MAVKPPALSLDELARICLDHLVNNPEQLAEFMVQTGLNPESLRRVVGTESFAHGLVDYVVADEQLLLAVAAGARTKPESITLAWARLHRHEA